MSKPPQRKEDALTEHVPAPIGDEGKPRPYNTNVLVLGDRNSDAVWRSRCRLPSAGNKIMSLFCFM
ncbi:MAG: hypothetical protein LBQ66_06510 [Planctomycetaceae bacterium]|nr:hypothetical protein [Planctomycetaceae bacterium]